MSRRACQCGPARCSFLMFQCCCWSRPPARRFAVKNRLVLLGVGLLVAGITCLEMISLLKTSPWITRESCDKIRPGMSEREVEAILGGPAWSRTTGTRLGVLAPGQEACWWRDSHGNARVVFDETGHALDVSYWANTRPSFLDQARSWFGL